MTCAKAKVECWIVHPSGAVFYGSNDCATPVNICPRTADEGYEKCTHVCNQEGHAEQVALKKARHFARGATVFVTHHRICDNCADLLFAAGVDRVLLAKNAPVFFQQ